MAFRDLKVGDLAARTGVSVRTLHHYDQVGLLQPSGRTHSGHRLYDSEDIARLQRIKSLRQLGLGLKQIAAIIDRPDHGAVDVLRRHAASLRDRIAVEQRLCERLERVAERLEQSTRADIDELLSVIEETTMLEKFEKYYTAEQLDTLAAGREALGPEGMKNAQLDWTQLLAEVREAVDGGLDPKSVEARALAARWNTLIEAFTGGDVGIRQSLANMYRQEPNIAASRGYQPEAGIQEFLASATE